MGARTAQSMTEAEEHRQQILDATRQRLEHERLKWAEAKEHLLNAQEQDKDQRLIHHISKEVQRTHGRMVQLHIEKKTWGNARRPGDTMQPQELLIEEKLAQEAKHMVELRASLQQKATLQQGPSKQRPSSAGVAVFSRTGGIPGYSGDTPRSVASYDARE